MGERSQPDVLTAHGENHWQQFGLLEALMFHFADDLDPVCFAQGCHSVAASDGDCARQGPRPLGLFGLPVQGCAGDLRELPRVPLRGEGSCGGGGPDTRLGEVS